MLAAIFRVKIEDRQEVLNQIIGFGGIEFCLGGREPGKVGVKEGTRDSCTFGG